MHVFSALELAYLWLIVNFLFRILICYAFVYISIIVIVFFNALTEAYACYPIIKAQYLFMIYIYKYMFLLILVCLVPNVRSIVYSCGV